jgi:septum formation protein
MFITINVVHMTLRKNFLLASNSSSRYRLLKSAGLKFQTTKPLCNEELIKEKLLNLKINIKNLPLYLAREKALSVSKKTNSLVVGSDTVIVFQNTLISKAKNLNEAKKKLQKLSGKKHKIISAVSVCQKEKQIWCSKQESTITLKKLNNDQIDEYLKRAGKQILSSVGCYQVEKLGPQIIKSIKGDFFNVLGFPLFPFLSFLSNKEK